MESINWKLVGAGWLLAWGLLGLAQVGPGGLGPFLATTDARGAFFAETKLPFLRGVEGEVAGPTGTPLASVKAEVYLEPRFGLTEILGIGNIEAVWLVVEGYEPERITDFTIATASLPIIKTGRVELKPSKPCDPCTYEFVLTRDDCKKVRFLFRHCEKGRWGPWSFEEEARKHTALPKPGPACTWFVVAKETKQTLTYTFYHSDGKTWQERGTLVIVIVKARPARCEVCTYIVVKGADGTYTLYHCAKPNEWKVIGEWKTEEPPPEEPERQPEPPKR